MKNRLIKYIHKSSENLFEFYRNDNNKCYGPYKKFTFDGYKDYEGMQFNDSWVGIWSGYNGNGTRRMLDTNKELVNGIEILFKYEK